MLHNIIFPVEGRILKTLKMLTPLYIHLLPDTQPNTNLGTAVKGFQGIIKIPNQLTLRKEVSPWRP